MTLSSGTRLGQYEITAKLGEGGMGEVYRATDTRLDRQVAIKVLPAEFTEDKERLARFEREAKLLAQLHHPNIASIFGLEESDGTRALVMELVDGLTLAERLESGAFAIAESLSVALQIAQALEEAHEKGIVHRDLKPQNIKASIEGKVKVLDFGLAKAMDPSAGSAASAADLARSPTLMQSPTLTAAHGTQLGVILGTAAYMAPEQARGVTVDKRADIWAFGVVLYEMLVGRSLFAGDTVTDTLAGVLKTEIDFSKLPESTPPAIRQLLRRCLERNPKNRLHDIADARIVLEEQLRGEGATEPARMVEVPPRGASRREQMAWSVALLVGCAAVATFVLRQQAPDRAAGTATQVTRFAVVPEEKGSLQGFPALSPDGRTMIFSLRPDEGPAILWAHSFESGASRTLAGTTGAQQPFWSPDGKKLAFFAGGQLKRLDLATGLSQTVVPASDPRGGSWSDDGEIYYSSGASSALSQVSASSGPSHRATELDSSRGEQSHRFPLALPGGALIYTCFGNDEIAGIYWRGPAGTPARRILPEVSRASYDRRGYLLWVHDGSLVAQRFDPANGTLSGEISPLAAQIGAEEQAAAEDWYSVSASGTIALRHGARESTELAWFDRRGAPLAAVTSAARLMEPALSPDGRQVAVQTVTAGEKGQLWIFDAAGLDQGRRLTFDAGGETPVWSPDGRAIAYTSPRTSGWAVFRKSSDGSGAEELLFESGVGCWVDSWFPDGKSLLIERYDPDRGADLWILPLDGSKKAVPFLEGRANEAHAAVSPDGKLVAYVSDDGGVGQVFVRAVASAGGNWQVSRDGGDWPHWRADGKELYFAGHDRVLRAVPVTSTDPFSFATPIALFRLRTPEPKVTSNRTYFSPAPDGQRFLVNQLVGEGGGARIEVVMNWSPPPESR